MHLTSLENIARYRVVEINELRTTIILDPVQCHARLIGANDNADPQPNPNLLFAS